MNKLKMIFARFLIVCWILTTIGFSIGLIVGLFKFDIEAISAAFIFPLIFYSIIICLSFVFLGIIHPKKLIQLIKAP